MNDIEEPVKDASSPLLSVVVPFYNAENTLLDTVRSVLSQTYSNWELLLADDGSTDGSLALARRIADPRIRVFSDGHNRGGTHRLNQMIAEARGEYIAKLDADDLMHPERLQMQLDYMRQHPDCDLVCSAAVSMSNELKACGLRDMQPLDVSAFSILRSGAIIHPTIFVRTDWFRANNYREGYDRAEDRELWIRAAPNSVMGKVVAPLLFYREVSFFFVQKFLLSYVTERKILCEYGPARIGWARSLLLYLRSLGKSLVIRSLHLLGQGERVIGRRYEAAAAMEEYQDVIDRIRRVAVPGID